MVSLNGQFILLSATV